MPNVALIVNPQAGNGERMRGRLAELRHTLENRGMGVTLVETTAAPHSARELAAAVANTCDWVLACGGDGTVHGVLQGVAHSRATLGVLPFGTANALARNLGLSLDPVVALRQLLGFRTKRLPLGEVTTDRGNRWFLVMAGAGPDGMLVEHLRAAAKARLGRRAYYTEAARLFLSRRFACFRVEYRTLGSADWKSRTAIAMMASRVPDLGGLFRGLTKTSRLDHPHLHVQLVSPPAHAALPAWVAFARTGIAARNPWLHTVEVEALRCIPPQTEPVYSQVDGEATGPIPMSLRIVPDALSLLMP